MKKAKRARLEVKAWKVGMVAEFLKLMPEGSALVETKLARSYKRHECRTGREGRSAIRKRLSS